MNHIKSFHLLTIKNQQNRFLKWKTINQRVKGDPLNPFIESEIIKPGELIDITELNPLTLTDRRTYNLLLANAWQNIDRSIVHRIEKIKLKGTHHGNERLENTINKLMGTIVVVTIVKNGQKRKKRIQLLGPNEEEVEETGFLYYRFPEELIQLIINSGVYARLKPHIMFCFCSKYALCLYEIIEKRKNLEYKQYEKFTIKEFRNLLNVPKNKLKRFADLNKYVLQIAIKEVNILCEFHVQLKLHKIGRKITYIELYWFNKTNEEKLIALKKINKLRKKYQHIYQKTTYTNNPHIF